MTEYTSAIDLAARLIIKKGRQVLVRHLETDAQLVDPNRPWDKPEPLPSDISTKVVFIDYELKFIDGQTIKTKDKQGYMFAKGAPFKPTNKDKVYDKIDKKWWNIMEVETIAPGDEDVLYILQLRR